MKKLVLAASLLIISSCSFFGGDDDPLVALRVEVQATVIDDGRADEMLEALDQLDELLQKSAALLADTRRKERVLIRDYDSSADEFAAMFLDASERRQQLQSTMLEVHLEFKANATQEEWDALRPNYSSAISARVNSLVANAIK